MLPSMAENNCGVSADNILTISPVSGAPADPAGISGNLNVCGSSEETYQ